MIGKKDDIISMKLNGEDINNAYMKVLVGPDQGWESHVMRLIEVEPGGNTPKHKHPWPHINFIVEGKGILMIDNVEHVVEPGAYAYVPADHIHQFLNRGDLTFSFLCIVPKEGHK
ncbi:MAG: cupin domain-containing protein [Bacilli bacterium]|nr:cupin domain-containing protein [Bacilli bacterium]